MSMVKLPLPHFHIKWLQVKNGSWLHSKDCHGKSKNNGTLQIDITTLNITPFLSNLKVENPPFIGLVVTCPILLGDVNVPIGTILPNINHRGKYT
jgi:hypothetical protein